MSMQSELHHLDRAVALSRLGGDEQLLQEIAKLFIDDYPHTLAEVRGAVQARDARGVERSAHALKGAVANFGANQVVAAAIQLETMGRSHHLDGAEQALAALEGALEELRPDLARLCGEPSF